MKRRIEYDVVRIFACLTILIIHFNATVCGWNNGQFVYNNSLIPNYYFDCVYLGEIGNSLFFILSGAALLCNRNNYNITPKNLFDFYWKRLVAILPAFYIVFLSATFLHLVLYQSMYDGPMNVFIQTITGMDGFALDRHWVDSNFYQVGEWFLGCIILCYAAWPLVTLVWRKIPTWMFVILAVAMYVVSVKLGDGNDRIITVRLAQMIAGAAFTYYEISPFSKKTVLFTLAVGLGCLLFRNYLYPITVTFAFCWMLFLGMTIVVRYFSEYFDKMGGIAFISAATYPAFLIHHKLIFILTYGMDFSRMQYRQVLILFIGYVLATFFLSYKVLALIKYITPLLKRISKNALLRATICTGMGVMICIIVAQAFQSK